mmetsp:Transcript_25878/g.56747  ORF Transcript_25878/g.56747 Transcript_25878/m.56747 type:complete len:351 (-) Transcript_25878:102-1154(-)
MAANKDLRVRIRDGCRGGKEQFTWSSIKEQEFKDREQYLGQSMKVGLMGKFGRYYTHDWYARKRDSAESIADEQESVQAYEQELMQEALGLKPKKLLLSKKQLSPEEFEEFIQRDKQKSKEQVSDGKRGLIGKQKRINTDQYGEEQEAEEERGNMMGERTAGLGFAAHRSAKLEAMKAETLGTESELQGSKSRMESIMAKYKPQGMKMEDDVKKEVKEEEDDERLAIAGGSSSSATAKVEVKQEVKEELEDRGHKRGREDKEEQLKTKKEMKKEMKKEKKEKKELKKLKKKEKKEKKKEKKLLQKAKKEVEKAEKLKSKLGEQGGEQGPSTAKKPKQASSDDESSSSSSS